MFREHIKDSTTITHDGIEFEVEYEFYPEVPPPLSANPSDPAYADPGDSATLDITSIKHAGDELFMIVNEDVFDGLTESVLKEAEEFYRLGGIS